MFSKLRATLVLTFLLLATWLVLPVSVQTTIANNAADMASHIVMVADSSTPRTVTNLFTFNRGGTVAPFAVGNAGAGTVTNLDANFLQAQNGAYYQNSTNQNAGTLPFARFPTVTWTVTTVTTTGTQNDWAPTITGNTQLRCNNASLLTAQGIAAGTDGQLLELVSVGAGQVDLAPQNAGSSAANRLLNFVTVGSTSLAAGSGVALYRYDGTTARWRMLYHEQGTWITPAYAGGNYTATGGGTWTVDSGDVTVFKYRLSGRTLQVNLTLDTTSITTTVNVANVLIPGGYTTAAQATSVGLIYDNSATVAVAGLFRTLTAATTLNFAFLGTATNFSAATNTTYLRGVIAFEVQ